MKNLVVYYSWTGNTEVAAKVIHDIAGGDIIKIEEVKQRKAGAGFMGAAVSAIFGLKSRIKPMDFSLKKYDNIFLGSQVWAAHTVPAINTFLKKADLNNKKVYLFITKADEKVPQQVIDSISERVQKKGGRVIDSYSITTVMKSIIKPEDVKEGLSQWTNGLKL